MLKVGQTESGFLKKHRKSYRRHLLFHSRLQFDKNRILINRTLPEILRRNRRTILAIRRIRSDYHYRMGMEAEIEQVESQLAHAMIKADLDSLDLLLHEDLLFNTPHGVTVTKDEDIENYRSGAMDVRGRKFSHDQINVYVTSSFQDFSHECPERTVYVSLWTLVPRI